MEDPRDAERKRRLRRSVDLSCTLKLKDGQTLEVLETREVRESEVPGG